MVKVAGFKTWNSIKKRLKDRYFPVNLTDFFSKTLFTEHFCMSASADSSVPTKVLSHFYNHNLFVFSFMFFLIVGKEIPAPPF